MSQEKTTLEIIAPTVEEAVTRGLSQLGVSRDAVDVEVLDAGSRGIFGIGSRQARVRLAFRMAAAAPQAVVTEAVPTPKPVVEAPVVTAPKVEVAAVPAAAVSAEKDQVLRVSEQVVGELLDKMSVKVRSVTAVYVTSDESKAEPTVLVNVEGEDLSILIGRHSETLNALQYIAGLIIGKELESWVPLMIDVQGYRSRRERQLRQLAQRMAEQAIHTGRKQPLEPMPANERRIIHLALRDHPQVVTESTGEEPNRKVVITLKK